MASYPGGKGGSGVYQTIINQMPPHDVYIEAFLGGGAVMRAKKPARFNIGIDLDTAVLAEFNQVADLAALRPLLVNYSALDFLGKMSNGKLLASRSTLVYCDPPYLMDVRSSQRPIYRYEIQEADHVRLLDLVLGLGCMVMISGYASELYDSRLVGWRRLTFMAMTRSGRQAEEVLWCNYPEPFELHDYSYLGSDYRQRENIKRKKARWAAKLRAMSLLERGALLEAIQDLTGENNVVVDRPTALDMAITAGGSGIGENAGLR